VAQIVRAHLVAQADSTKWDGMAEQLDEGTALENLKFYEKGG
jgi:hypothetical protein